MDAGVGPRHGCPEAQEGGY
uniref:Uncharacterized protein n=1 Tax=Arundo donax TaxID=35708 RepID=A0A0A9A0E7_ARUDO